MSKNQKLRKLASTLPMIPEIDKSGKPVILRTTEVVYGLEIIKENNLLAKAEQKDVSKIEPEDRFYKYVPKFKPADHFANLKKFSKLFPDGVDRYLKLVDRIRVELLKSENKMDFI